jgi:hypothetical protein
LTALVAAHLFWPQIDIVFGRTLQLFNP